MNKSNRKDKVLYLCLQVTKEGQASHAHVHEIIKGLRNEGWNVDLKEPRYVKKSVSPRSIGRLIEFVRLQLAIIPSIRRCNLLYIRGHVATILTIILAKVFSKPYVYEVNGSYESIYISYPYLYKFRRIIEFLEKYQLKNADGIIAGTPQLATWVTQESGNNLTYIIPNGANTNLFRPGVQSKINLPKKYVVFVGSFTRWHGIETMFKAVDEYLWPFDVKLIMIGEGVEENKICIAKKNEKIIMLGKIPYKEVPGILGSAIVALSIFALCPKNAFGDRMKYQIDFLNGLSPLKVYEALATGRPVIVTDFRGQADLIRNNSCGLVIPPNDPTALAEAVRYLADNPKTVDEMGQNGRRIVEALHSWQLRAIETGRVLEKIISKYA